MRVKAKEDDFCYNKIDSNVFTVPAASRGHITAMFNVSIKRKWGKKKLYSKVSIVLKGNALTCFDAGSTTKAGISKKIHERHEQKYTSVSTDIRMPQNIPILLN